ncbi:MAG: 2Fe-2S iron-sulfur cluster-binding protein [Bifidobacterium tsurumiense]|uniref:succinate dehydrogenase/fumarate reductase iron-sulfur subunit n=1 Tax=Bifidobacterium tsurumiense TaxID=356829 RepID=UPI002A800035|nr:2Fe-2S iron-sulfur cluster-binding protein [Bifidobacterium tsurumiense]MDY4678041.1 2Fe-2S iron-sulfur cluster-binding protein [Bifidobacterium tsurumiense]
MASGIGTATVTIRVSRFTPRPERERGRSSSPFTKTRSPFGGSSSSSRRKPRGKQWTQDYVVQASGQDTILDCLLKIKRTMDPTLAFRYSCGHGMCGSDAVSINGTPALLCTATVEQWAVHSQIPQENTFRRTGVRTDDIEVALESSSSPSAQSKTPASQTGVPAASSVPSPGQGDWGVISLSALPGFPVQRDLIADIDSMLEQIIKLKPYLQADGVLATTDEGKVDVFEYLQRPDQLAKYEVLSNCIACGVCEGSCPVFAGGDAFIGPAALVNASRFINDSRDQATDARMDAIDTADGIAACQSVRACSRQCPKGIDVGEEIWQLIAQVRER